MTTIKSAIIWVGAILAIIAAAVFGGAKIAQLRQERDQYKGQLKEAIADEQDRSDQDDEDHVIDAMPERTVVERVRKSAALRASIRAMREKT